MSRGGKTWWKALEVRGPGSSHTHPPELRDLDASERLAALYRFQNGIAEGHRFLRRDGGRRAEITDPAEVDWESFPLLAALEAVTTDELRRLRHLFTAGPAMTDEPTPPV